MAINTYAKIIIPYPLRDNQLDICRAFNQNVQYPHVIDTSMTIYIQGGIRFPK